MLEERNKESTEKLEGDEERVQNTQFVLQIPRKLPKAVVVS